MKWRKDRKQRMTVSLLAGMLAAMLMVGGTDYQKEPGVLAWWGTLYPRFCFAERQDEGTKEEGKDTGHKVKISFWLAKALDW